MCHHLHRPISTVLQLMPCMLASAMSSVSKLWLLWHIPAFWKPLICSAPWEGQTLFCQAFKCCMLTLGTCLVARVQNNCASTDKASHNIRGAACRGMGSHHSIRQAAVEHEPSGAQEGGCKKGSVPHQCTQGQRDTGHGEEEDASA